MTSNRPAIPVPARVGTPVAALWRQGLAALGRWSQTASGRSTERFSLSRWFALVALLSIALLATGAAYLMNRLMGAHLIAQDAELTREFVGSVVMVEKPLQAFFADPSSASREAEESFQHIANMHDMLRFNVYDRGRRITPTLPELERQALIRALNQHRWNVSRAARALGISRDTMRYRIDKHGLSTAMESLRDATMPVWMTSAPMGLAG